MKTYLELNNFSNYVWTSSRKSRRILNELQPILDRFWKADLEKYRVVQVQNPS